MVTLSEHEEHGARLRDVLRTAPPLMVILGETGQRGEATLALTDAILGAGVRLIQLRAKTPSDRRLFELARALVERCAEHGAHLIVNDRIDIALAAGANGVHLGVSDLPLSAARKLAGKTLWIGATVHDLERLPESLELADYVGLGTIFRSPTKPNLPARGLELIEAARARLTQVPIFAIGGIDENSAAACLAAGATGVAVGSAVTHARDPSKAARSLLAALGSARSTP